MRLTSLAATDFGPFEHVHVPLEGPITVIVGPNGAGKSNQLSIMTVAGLALGWAGGGVRDAFGQLQIYAAAFRQGARSDGFAIRLAWACTEEWERRLWVSFIRAVLAAGLIEHVQSRPERRQTMENYVDSVTEETIAPLLDGSIVVQYTAGRTTNWSLGYDIEVEGRPYCIAMQGAAVSDSIFAGPLPLTLRPGTSGRFLKDKILDGDELPEQFEFAHILPSDLESITLQLSSTSPSGLRWVEEFLAQIGSPDPGGGRSYSAAVVLHLLISRSVTLLGDQRPPVELLYQPEELGTRPDLMDGSRVPLELYCLKNGSLVERDRYDQITALFRKMTGYGLDLRSRSYRRQPPAPSSGVVVEPVVVDGRSELPVTRAGAGLAEMMVISTILCGDPGRVIVLDEPATRLGPTFQRRLLAHLRAADRQQVLIVTHSPYLVPTETVAEMEGVLRVVKDSGTSTVRRIGDMVHAVNPSAAADMKSRWWRLVATSADVRSTLFASGVILVEGDTELGLFGYWFGQLEEGEVQPAEALNLEILPVGGDAGFGTFVAYLRAMHIPWVIVCDGPVLSPGYGRKALVEQLRRVGALETDATTPAAPSDFNAWKAFWSNHCVLTLARDFGNTNGDSKKGEIEAYLQWLDAARWIEANDLFPKSKIRAAHWFAQHVVCPPEVTQLYRDIVRLLFGPDETHGAN